jgi:hypothetical protein
MMVMETRLEVEVVGLVAVLEGDGGTVRRQVT